MRLFVALEIDERVRSQVASFLNEMRALAPGVRWVQPESLHVTLKFIGERDESEAERIRQALAAIARDSFEAAIRGCGFFPDERRARVFWIGIAAGPELSALARAVDERLEGLNIPREAHDFNPHLTLARAGGGSGAPRKQPGDARNYSFRRLQERLAAAHLPEFGTMTAREFFLYQSRLSPGGSRYAKIARFALR